jgi:hypothetical protein
MMGDFKMEMSSDKNIQLLFIDLPRAVQNKIIKPLLKEGGAMIAVEEKQEAPANTGLLRTAIGASSIRKYPSSFFVAVGVRQGFRRAIQTSSSGKTRYLGKQKTEFYPEAPVQDPTKYLGIVSGGRKAISVLNKKVLYDVRSGQFFGTQVKEQDANPFIQRAFDEVKDTVAETLTAQAETQILAEAKAILQ